ncbi:MAG: hypothetical protein FWF81_08020 [Defluviitaleaceae bacterium]|nr:hypothetical protein [Defluviitaleaceae bacterium]
MIKNYNDFVETLLSAGFSMAGGSTDGIYAIVDWGWNEAIPYETPIRWHTGDKDTDPWEWRIRVLDERKDIAYAKVFFKKSGFITKEWYPYFLAARRGGDSFEDAYKSGTISYAAKRIYDVVAQNGTMPTHLMRQAAGFSAKEDKSAFDKALTELQMQMFLTMCGRAYKTLVQEESGCWASTVFCTTESYFGDAVFEQAEKIEKDEACEKITEQILCLNPSAQGKKIKKFIFG